MFPWFWVVDGHGDGEAMLARRDGAPKGCRRAKLARRKGASQMLRTLKVARLAHGVHRETREVRRGVS